MTQRPLSVIAQEIAAEWPKPYYGAVPYLEAMKQLHSIEDYFGADDAHSIVRYFLSNAGQFHGPKARALKAELRSML